MWLNLLNCFLVPVNSCLSIHGSSIVTYFSFSTGEISSKMFLVFINNTRAVRRRFHNFYALECVASAACHRYGAKSFFLRWWFRVYLLVMRLVINSLKCSVFPILYTFLLLLSAYRSEDGRENELPLHSSVQGK